MHIDFHSSVLKFLHKIDNQSASDVYSLIEVLRQRGNTISMPFSKPIRNGLHELRVQGRPAFRVLYGFCEEDAVLLVAIKKQKPSLDSRDIKLALERLRIYCNT
ncbi:MAG: type II toxin-antitoxin system RelE/ParE family toxin [Patescibacteria group bacterium]